MGGDAFERHHVEDLLADGEFALTGAVLHDLGAVFADHRGHVVGDGIERQVLDVGHAASQRHDLGAVRDGEQRSDGGGPHPLRAF